MALPPNSLRASKSSADYIATNLSEASVEDLSRDVYDNLNSIQTALEAVRENQMTVPEKAYFLGTRIVKPPFDADAEGLPGKGWSSNPVETPQGKALWYSERLVSATGTSKTPWSEPIVITGEDGKNGSYEESWFIVSKSKPARPTTYLPEAGWSRDTPSDSNAVVWMSQIAIKFDGADVSTWTDPIRVSGATSLQVFFRYIASTDKPVIVNPASAVPRTPSGEEFTTTIPSTSHPDKSYVWVTTATFSSNGDIVSPWIEPTKFSTPDTTKVGKAWAIGDMNQFPSFDAQAEGLPGDGWHLTPPNPLPSDKFYWFTERLEWTDGTKQTSWNYPIRMTGQDGKPGIPGHDGTPGAGQYTVVNNTAAENFPSDVQATELFKAAVGRNPVKGDGLTFVNETKSKTQSKRYDGSRWVVFDYVVDGAVLIRGSVNTDALAANAITTEKLQANLEIITPTLRAARIEGTLVYGTNVTATGTVTGGTLKGTTIENGDGSFRVLSDGTLTATKATITGHVNATSGTFNGDVVARTLTLTGNIPPAIDNSKVTAGSIGAETPSGAQSKADAAKNAAIADAANKAAQAQSNAQKWTEDRIYPNQSKLQITGNYSKGKTGWAIDSEGNAEFNNAVVRGHMYAASLTFTGTIPASIDNSVAEKNAATDATNKANQAKKDAAADATAKANAAQKAASALANDAKNEAIKANGKADSANSNAIAANAAAQTANKTAQSAASKADLASELTMTLSQQMYPDQSQIQIKSGNYASGSRGWAIDANGNAEFNNATFRGTVYATNGSFNGTIAAQSGYLNNVTINSSCTIKGTLSAGQIVGDIVDMVDVNANATVTVPAVNWQRKVKLVPVYIAAYSYGVDVSEISAGFSINNTNDTVFARAQSSAGQNDRDVNILSSRVVIIPAGSSITLKYTVKPKGRSYRHDPVATFLISKYK